MDELNADVTPEEAKIKKGLSPLAKRIINIVVDVVVVIVLAFAVLLAVCTIRSRAKGYSQYTEIFNHAYLSVASPSMEPDDIKSDVVIPDGKPSGFSEGDLIKIKLLKTDSAKSSLQVGDVITFVTSGIKDGYKVLNTHRIVAVNELAGGTVNYTTRGDANAANDSIPVYIDDIVGVYEGESAAGVGTVMLWMSTTQGFFVCVVLPTLLIVVYCIVNLILVITKEKKVQKVAADEEHAKQLDEERERIRQELLAEMNGGTAPPVATPSVPEESAADNAAPTDEQEPIELVENKTEEKSEDDKPTE